MPSRVTPLNRRQLIELDVLVQTLTNTVINKSYECNHNTKNNVNSCSSPVTAGSNQHKNFAVLDTSLIHQQENTKDSDEVEQVKCKNNEYKIVEFTLEKEKQTLQGEEEQNNSCEEIEEHEETELHPILDGRYVDVFNDPIVNGKENILQRWKWHEKMLYFVWWSFLPSRCEECGMSGSWNVSPETEARCGQCGWAVGSTASRKVVEDIKRKRERGSGFNAGSQAESSDDDDEEDDDDNENDDDDDDDDGEGDDNDIVDNHDDDDNDVNIHEEENDIIIEQESMDDNFIDHDQVDVEFDDANVESTVNSNNIKNSISDDTKNKNNECRLSKLSNCNDEERSNLSNSAARAGAADVATGIAVTDIYNANINSTINKNNTDTCQSNDCTNDISSSELCSNCVNNVSTEIHDITEHECKENETKGHAYVKSVKMKNNVHKFVLGSTLINKSLSANGKAGLYNYADAKKNVFAAFTFYCDWLQRTEIIMHAHNIQTAQIENQKELEWEENVQQEMEEEQEPLQRQSEECVKREANSSKVKAQKIHSESKRNVKGSNSLANFPNGEELARVIREAYEMSQLLLMPGLSFAHTTGRSGLDKNSLLIRAGCLYLTLTLHRYHIPFPLFASASDNAWISAILHRRMAAPVKRASNRLRLQWNDVELLASLLGVPIGNFFESVHVVEQYMTNLFILVTSSRCALHSPIKNLKSHNTQLHSSVPSIIWHPFRVRKRCEYIMSFSHVERANACSHVSSKSNYKTDWKCNSDDLCPEFIAVAMSLELARQVDELPLIQISGSMNEAASHSARIGAWLDELGLYPTRQVYRSMEWFTKQVHSKKNESESAKRNDNSLHDKEALEQFYKMLTTRAAISDPLFAQDDLKVNVLLEKCDTNDSKNENYMNVNDGKEKTLIVNSNFTNISHNEYTNDLDRNVNVSESNDAAKSTSCIDNQTALLKVSKYTTSNSPFHNDFALIFPSPCANALLHIFARTFRLTTMELADQVIQSGIYTGKHYFVERLQEYMCQGLYSVLPLYRRLSPITSFWLSLYMALYSEHRTVLLSVLHRLSKPVQYKTTQISRNEMNSLIKLLQSILRSHGRQLRLQFNFVIRVNDEREQHFNGIYYCSSYLGQSGLVTFTCIRSGRKTLTFNRYNKQISLCYLSAKEKLVKSLRYTCGSPVVIEVESPVTKQILDTMLSSNSANLSLIKLNTNEFTKSAYVGNVNSNSAKNNNSANNFNGDLPNHAADWRSVVRALCQLAYIRRRMRIPMLAARLNALQSLHTLRSERKRENRLVYEHTEFRGNGYGYDYSNGLPYETRYTSSHFSLPMSHFGQDTGFASGQHSWLTSAHEIDSENLLNSSSLSLATSSSLTSNSDEMFDLLSLQNYVCLNFLSLPHHSLLFGLSEERIVALYTSVLTLLEIINEYHQSCYHNDNDTNEKEEQTKQIPKTCTEECQTVEEEHFEQENKNDKFVKTCDESSTISECGADDNNSKSNWLHANNDNFNARNKIDVKSNKIDKDNTLLNQEWHSNISWIDELIHIYNNVVCHHEKKQVSQTINNTSIYSVDNNGYAENVQVEQQNFNNVNMLPSNRVETPCYAPISTYSHGGSGVVTPIHSYSDVKEREKATQSSERVRGTESNLRYHAQEAHCTKSSSNTMDIKDSIAATTYLNNNYDKKQLARTATPPLLTLAQMTPVLQAKNVHRQGQKRQQSKVRVMQQEHHKKHKEVQNIHNVQNINNKYTRKEYNSLSDESDAESESETEVDLDAFQLTTSTADAWRENSLPGHKINNSSNKNNNDGSIELNAKKALISNGGRCSSVSSAESMEETACNQLHSYRNLNKEGKINSAQIIDKIGNQKEQCEHQNFSHLSNDNSHNYNNMSMSMSATYNTQKTIECLKLVQLYLCNNLPTYTDVLLGKAKINMQILSECNNETLSSIPAYITVKSQTAKKLNYSNSSSDNVVKQVNSLALQENSNVNYDNTLETSFANYNLFTAEECRQKLAKLHEFVKKYLLVKKTLWHAAMTGKIATKSGLYAEKITTYSVHDKSYTNSNDRISTERRAEQEEESLEITAFGVNAANDKHLWKYCSKNSESQLDKQQEDKLNLPNEDDANKKRQNKWKWKEEKLDENDNTEITDMCVKQEVKLNINADNPSNAKSMKREREEAVNAVVGISEEEDKQKDECTLNNSIDMTMTTPVLRTKRHKTGRQRRRGERREERKLEKYNKVETAK